AVEAAPLARRRTLQHVQDVGAHRAEEDLTCAIGAYGLEFDVFAVPLDPFIDDTSAHPYRHIDRQWRDVLEFPFVEKAAYVVRAGDQPARRPVLDLRRRNWIATTGTEDVPRMIVVVDAALLLDILPGDPPLDFAEVLADLDFFECRSLPVLVFGN